MNSKNKWTNKDSQSGSSTTKCTKVKVSSSTRLKTCARVSFRDSMISESGVSLDISFLVLNKSKKLWVFGSGVVLAFLKRLKITHSSNTIKLDRWTSSTIQRMTNLSVNSGEPHTKTRFWDYLSSQSTGTSEVNQLTKFSFHNIEIKCYSNFCVDSQNLLTLTSSSSSNSNKHNVYKVFIMNVF